MHISSSTLGCTGGDCTNEQRGVINHQLIKAGRYHSIGHAWFPLFPLAGPSPFPYLFHKIDPVPAPCCLLSPNPDLASPRNQMRAVWPCLLTHYMCTRCMKSEGTQSGAISGGCMKRNDTSQKSPPLIRSQSVRAPVCIGHTLASCFMGHKSGPGPRECDQ